MKKMDIDTRKLIGTIVGGIAFICCIIFMTYAWYTWRSENLALDKTISDEESDVVEIIFENGGNVSITNMAPVLHIEDGEVVEFTAQNNGTAAADIFVDLKINTIDTELVTNSFKYAIVKSEVELTEDDIENGVDIDESTLVYDYDNIVAEGNFSDATTTTTINIGNDEVLGLRKNYYKVIFYIDGNIKNDINMMEKSFEADITIRNSDNPTANISTTTTKASTTQEMTLTCSDLDGVTSYYLGGTSPTSSSTYTSITTQTKMTMTTTVSSTGTYYFACKDTDGNTSEIKSVSFYNYTVQTMLLNITGTEGVYTQNNYASLGTTSQYLASNIGTFKLATYYTIPTGASDATFKGYSTGSPSYTTAVTPSTKNPKLTETVSFVMWFDRIEYPITITAGTGGSITARRERNASTIAATATSGTSKIVNVRHNETLTLTASPSTSYTFSKWSGGSTATTATIRSQITAEKEFTANFTAK